MEKGLNDYIDEALEIVAKNAMNSMEAAICIQEKYELSDSIVDSVCVGVVDEMYSFNADHEIELKRAFR